MKKLLGLAFLLAFSGSLMAQTTEENKAKAEAMVNKALTYYQANGEAKTFEAINDKKGQFVDGSFYVFVYDFDGKCLAHGFLESRIGKVWIDLADSTGFTYMKEFIKVAKSKNGQGWVGYKMKNPTSQKTEPKITFIKRVPGKNYFFGCGTYPVDKK